MRKSFAACFNRIMRTVPALSGMMLAFSCAVAAGETTWYPSPSAPAQTTQGGSSDGGQLPYARVRVAIPSAAAQGDPGNPSGQYSAPSNSYPTSSASSSSYSYGSSSSGSYYIQPQAEPAKALEPMALATLNGKAITDLDVMRELWSRRGRETLDWMIGRDILLQELSRLGLEISDEEVGARLQKHLEGLRKAFPALTNPDDLTRAASGMRVDEYRERSVWAELALRKIMRIAHKPSDEQLRGYFAEKRADFIQPERVKISQVFIAPQSVQDGNNAPGRLDWAVAERQILEANNRLRMGEDFVAVARTYGSGGQLSRWVGRGELMRELEDAAFSIRPGSMSSPIKSAMGFHIILVEDRRERALPKFEDVRTEVLEMYEDRLFLHRAGDYMITLREDAVKSGGLVVADNPSLFSESGKE